MNKLNVQNKLKVYNKGALRCCSACVMVWRHIIIASRQRQHPYGVRVGRSDAGAVLKPGNDVWLMCRQMSQSAAIALATSVPAFWADITSNVIFMSGFCGWFIAQFGKVFTNYYKKGKWDMGMMVASGGMPSSHSALCMVRILFHIVLTA